MYIQGWIIIGLAALCAMLLAWGIIRVFLPSRLPRGREAICGRCRYPVRGLGDWRCPECGTDLRIGGIVTPELRHRARAPLGGGIVSWIILMLLIGLGATPYAIRRFVTEIRSQAGVTQTTMDLYSGSGQYRGIEVTQVETQPDDGSPPTISTTLRMNIGDPLMADPSSLTGAQILEWMKEQGVDITVQRVQSEANEAARMVSSMRSGRVASGGVFRNVSMSTISRASGPVRTRYDINPWLWGIAAGWLLLLIGGLFGIIAVRRRQRSSSRRFAAPDADAGREDSTSIPV